MEANGVVLREPVGFARSGLPSGARLGTGHSPEASPAVESEGWVAESELGDVRLPGRCAPGSPAAPRVRRPRGPSSWGSGAGGTRPPALLKPRLHGQGAPLASQGPLDLGD